jgi:hypothetical protein
MLTRNFKRKKLNSHLSNRKETQPSKLSAINNRLRARQAGTQSTQGEIEGFSVPS